MIYTRLARISLYVVYAAHKGRDIIAASVPRDDRDIGRDDDFAPRPIGERPLDLQPDRIAIEQTQQVPEGYAPFEVVED